MINISGHLRNQRKITGFKDESALLLVNCCGEQIFKTKDYAQERTKGRVDYQIIYVYKGCGHYLLDGQWQSLSAGNIVLFRPFEPQVYSYYAKEKPEIYWIHFTGTACEELLKKFEIQNCYIGENLFLKQLFQSVITELQLKKLHYEEITVSQLYFMLSMISRLYKTSLQPFENDFSIDRLVVQLHQRYNESWTIASMADYCKLSEGYFAHTFRKQMGVSPMRYLNDLRIDKAKELLEAGTMSISAIASMTGFRDPLYFSKIFRKAVGMSPTDFKISQMEAQTPDWYS